MDEQWNSALDQVKDEYLAEAATYRPKRHWLKPVGAVAAVLILAIGLSILKPFVPTPDHTGNAPPASSEPDSLIPTTVSPDQDLPVGNNSDGSLQEGVDMVETLHFDTYGQFRTACEERLRAYLNTNIMVPLQKGEPMPQQDITVFEKEMYHQPWVWYYFSSEPHITVRVPTRSSLTANMDPNISGAEALHQIFPDAPNLHNKDVYSEEYAEIREVEILTAEGYKTALYRREAHRDRIYLTFLQNGTLVTIAAPENALSTDWLAGFHLIPISRIS